MSIGTPTDFIKQWLLAKAVKMLGEGNVMCKCGRFKDLINWELYSLVCPYWDHALNNLPANDTLREMALKKNDEDHHTMDEEIRVESLEGFVLLMELGGFTIPEVLKAKGGSVDAEK